MMKKLITICIIVFNIVFVIYLISPTPSIKNLPDSIKSTLPGDTTQLKNVEGFYTNLSRTEVMNFYHSIYSSPFLIQLNHPPEKSREIFRDTMQSYYLEEFVIPFKESIFINGFEWEKDVFTKPEKRIQNKLIYNGITYPSKINTRVISTSISTRIIVFFIVQLCIFVIFFCLKKFYKQNDK